ncbi:MAG: hypothetical protein ABIW19_02500 [Vicinamibacterales bacterium]
MRMPNTRPVALTLAITLAVLVKPLQAQFVVYDPTNYFEAVAQLEQMIRHYQFLLQQARRLPVDLVTRYHAHSLDWTFHDVNGGQLYAQSLLHAFNQGDLTGAAYRRAVAGLDVPTDVVGRMPASARRRLEAAYAAIEVADSSNRLAIDQTGSARMEGPFTLQAVKNVEHDAVNPGDSFQSQTALLQKIGSALAIQLRLGEQTNQFQMSALEQSILETTRTRETETLLMNATIRQWRYGRAYGDDLFSRTAERVDTWRPY